MKSFFDEFRTFISRGNVIDLAVAVVVGAAFGAVVTSFTNDVLMAFIGAVFGKPNFDSLTLTIGNGVIGYGKFLTALVNFVLVAFALFLVVKAVNVIQSRRAKDAEAKEAEAAAEVAEEVQLLTEIRDLLAGRGER